MQTRGTSKNIFELMTALKVRGESKKLIKVIISIAIETKLKLPLNLTLWRFAAGCDWRLIVGGGNTKS